MTTKKPYLLTGGLVPLIENRHGISLSESTQDALRKLEQTYFYAAASLLNGRSYIDKTGNKSEWEVRFVSDGVIEEDLGDLITNNQMDSGNHCSRGSFRPRPLISFDDVYCRDLPNDLYQVTRIQDPKRLHEDPQIGPRFDSPELKDQIKRLKEQYGNQIDLMDIGVYGGQTMSDEIQRFRKYGVDIKNIYVMFAGREGIDKIAALGPSSNMLKKLIG